MLRLKNITKDYKVADMKVKALKGLSLCFRQNEFVSVLGPSGCGKTTLLNIVGGLDKATSGELSIFGKSTKKYSSKDWDVYRNHRVGFIFQSYNLIPHQSVLGNVELALTIAGMSKSERVAKAKSALDKVGLSDQYYKKPNQLSGGQCQRVAIARALVNDPEILLADEPTGALDTKTSVQIMNLIKEIAKERLVIMVTHNPELAEEYSTRIIKLLDGELLDDSNPFTMEQENQEELKQAKEIKKEKAKMSFFTSFRLSLQNLFTKKKRTLMTSFAGSIGIIGVSFVLAISFGVQGFIKNMENDMLSGNPIVIAESSFDINGFMNTMGTGEQLALVKENGYINIESMMEKLAQRAETMENLLIQNTIDRNYVEFLSNMNREYLASMFYDYGLDVSNNIYTNYKDENPNFPNGREMSLSTIRAVYTSILSNIDKFKDYASLISSVSQSFSQAPDSQDYLLTQYDILYKAENTNGIAKQKNEIMIVLGHDRTLADLTLAQLGYYTQEEFINLANKADGGDYDQQMYFDKIDFEKIVGKSFTYYPNNSVFNRSTANPLIPFTYDAYHNSNDGIELKIVGILEPKENLSYGMLSNGFYYTSEFAEHVVKQNYNSELAKYARQNDLKTITSVATPVGGITTYAGLVLEYDYTLDGVTKQGKALIGKSDDYSALFNSIMGQGGTQVQVMSTFSLQQMGANVDSTITREENGDLIEWKINLDENGNVFALPNRIAVYPLDLEQKDFVLEYLDSWNSNEDIIINGNVLKAEDRENITYTDTLSIIMNMIGSLVQFITIALVSFTSLALVVSSVMIAIITYVSVVERIKEIGVIRSLGGRKLDIFNLFTAETFIIGFVSGVIGVTITYILSAILNILVGLAGVGSIASLPIFVAIIMVCVSFTLTLISGIIPSQSGAQKDPVVALRTE